MGAGVPGAVRASSGQRCQLSVAVVCGELISGVFVLALLLEFREKTGLNTKNDGAEFLWSAGGSVEPRTLFTSRPLWCKKVHGASSGYSVHCLGRGAGGPVLYRGRTAVFIGVPTENWVPCLLGILVAMAGIALRIGPPSHTGVCSYWHRNGWLSEQNCSNLSAWHLLLSPLQ